MRRLDPGQPVAVDLDGAPDSITCTVLAVIGGVALLSILRAGSPATIGSLAGGSQGYLVFSNRGAVIGLRGIARAETGEPRIRFAVTDGVQLPERRMSPRVKVSTRAVVKGGEGTEVDTETIDVSLLGVLLEWPAASDDLERVTVELYFGDHDPVRGEAAFARRTDSAVALSFTDLGDAERNRLAEFLAGHRVAARMAERGEPLPDQIPN